jgi:hypothetical protein
MLIHLKALHHCITQPRQSPASNFLAARIGAFKAWCCYAKIEPAALRCGGREDRGVERREAVGYGPEFRSGGFCPWLIALRLSPQRQPRWHEVEQSTPCA